MNSKRESNLILCIAVLLFSILLPSLGTARDLADIKHDGVLRHIGVSYANFVTEYKEGNQTINSGLDVELIKGFAQYLGVKYQFVPATWGNALGKLTGRNGMYIDNQVVYGLSQAIEGDVMAHGVTTLEWRKEIIDFSDDYFPSAVWLIARVESDLTPIVPTGNVNQDIQVVKRLLKNREVLAMRQSCLDPDLYHLFQSKAKVVLPTKTLKLNEMVPAILNDEAETTLLDLPDSLIALDKWPNKIKVIGPISNDQTMAVGFRKNSPLLRQAFNEYLAKIKADGSFFRLVNKHYPSVFYYYHDYFSNTSIN